MGRGGRVRDPALVLVATSQLGGGQACTAPGLHPQHGAWVTHDTYHRRRGGDGLCVTPPVCLGRAPTGSAPPVRSPRRALVCPPYIPPPLAVLTLGGRLDSPLRNSRASSR